ncbi:unnamed protein product [Ranitomeya imitator]|uniref:Uncharacterized protein n=1 Tax=Ranitomeya imitator TaxID=111125 RepID=A0ABN9M2N1_9NEOB|nr:unnamed protein product [Ranitomeya imitator]
MEERASADAPSHITPPACDSVVEVMRLEQRMEQGRKRETQCGTQTKEHPMDSRDTRHQDILLNRHQDILLNRHQDILLNRHQVVLLNKDLIQASVLQALTPTQDILVQLTLLLQAVFLVDMSFHQGRMDPMASMDIMGIMDIMDKVFLAAPPKHMEAIIRNTRRISTMDMDTDMDTER